MLKDLCFEVIQTCPNNCKFCSSNSSIKEKKIIPIDVLKKTVEHFIKNGGIEEISISGGEPFLHPDLFEMVRFCKENNIRTVIFTSGIKRSEKLSEEVEKETNVSKYLHSLVTSCYQKSVEDIANTQIGKNRSVRKRSLQQVMQESFFYGANRFGRNFIA